MPYKRKPRTFQYAEADRIFYAIRALVRSDGMTVNEIADAIGRSRRMTREYLEHLHKKRGELYISAWCENPSLRGKKLALYSLRDRGQKDAAKWWKKGKS